MGSLVTMTYVLITRNSIPRSTTHLVVMTVAVTRGDISRDADSLSLPAEHVKPDHGVTPERCVGEAGPPHELPR